VQQVELEHCVHAAYNDLFTTGLIYAQVLCLPLWCTIDEYLVEALTDLFSKVLRREELVEEGQESIVHNQRQLYPSCVCGWWVVGGEGVVSDAQCAHLQK
jgi:hypothetical protein